MNAAIQQTSYLFRQAWRSLRRKPGFVSSVVITMGTTLGALLCVSTLAYLLLAKPLPYADQERLYRVDHRLARDDAGLQIPAFTYPGIMHLYENQDVFSDTALISYGDDVISSAPRQPVVNIGYVTPEWFPLLNASFALGRGFGQTEAVDTYNPVAILSHQTWSQEFGSDADIVSKTVSISGINYRVVGVVSDSFVEPQIHGVDNKTGVWIPWDYNFGTKWRHEWRKFTGSLTFVGKLKVGISESQAQQTVATMVNDTWKTNVADFENFANSHIEIEMISFGNLILGGSQAVVYLLLAGVLGLVVIAFTNVVNLFMSRTAEQQQSLAIHAALGAKKSQLFFGLFAESSLLMMLSIGLAFVVMAGGFWVLRQHLEAVLPRVNELTIDFFTIGAALVALLLFSFLFARFSRNMIDYRALNSMLQSSGKGTGVQVSKRLRRVLITSQIAIATALVFVNISLFQASVQTITTPLGFDLDDTVYLTLSYGGRARPPLDEVAPVMTEVREKLLQQPEVKSLSQAFSPLENSDIMVFDIGDGGDRIFVEPKGVDDKYFEVIGQTLLEGQYFSANDFKDERQLAIVNDVMAKRIAPTGSALGQIRVSEQFTATIVGVVKSITKPGQGEPRMRYFYAIHPGVTLLLIKLQDNQSLSRERVGTLLREIGSEWSVWKFESLRENASKRLFAQTATAVTTAVLTVLTLFLAGVGLYGILSYSTQMRRFEIGTRMAIGAKRGDVIRLIVKDNATAISIGVGTGIVVLLALAYGFSEQLKGFFDWQLLLNLIAVLTLVGSIAFVACYVPLREYINRPAVNSLRGNE